MPFRYRLLSVLVLLCPTLASTHPLNQTSTIPHPNTSPVSSPPSHEITCYQPALGRLPATLSGCLPSLNALIQFPNYRRLQPFLEYRSPEKPYPPPYVVHEAGSSCTIDVGAKDTGVVDYFSFGEVRRRAGDILAVCEERGGVGGWAALGSGIGWGVRVIGTVAAGAGEGLMKPAVRDGEGVGDGSGRGRVVDTA